MVKRIKVEDDEDEPAPKVVRRGGGSHDPEDDNETRKMVLTAKLVQGAETNIYFKSKPCDITGRTESRHYFAGLVPLAFVEVYKDGYGPEKNVKSGKVGKFVCHNVDTGRGNGGVGFETEKALHAYMVEALQAKP